MADSKISALPASTTPLDGIEVLPIVQSSTTKQVSVANLTAGRNVSALSYTSGSSTGTTTTLNTNQQAGSAASPLYMSYSFKGYLDNEMARIRSWDESGSTGFGYLEFLTASSASAAVTRKMLIGPTGVITMSAYGAGAATFSAAGVISSVSDETWKIKDGVPENPDEMLKKLEPGYWYYNDEKKEVFGAERQLGFYAQNVNAAIGFEAAPQPEKDKPWGYYDRSVLAVVVLSLQKALAAIETLEAKVAALELK